MNDSNKQIATLMDEILVQDQKDYFKANCQSGNPSWESYEQFLIEAEGNHSHMASV